MAEDTKTSDMLLKHWGERVKERRGERSQKWLADVIGCDQTVVSRVERGVYNLSADLMVGFAAALNVELETLFAFPPGLVSRELYQRQVSRAS